MLGLRLDEPLLVGRDGALVDEDSLRRLEAAGLVEVDLASGEERSLRLTRRGRFLGGAVTAELLA
jgi:hypothetical protein